ncbi:hypothetical protein F5Y00DRAFT_55200 [Daldinia vernicosa]|uniref:uncharacterized protein n=1 Tax=Daldinia vernicosa TaxID=114800 RepID=UPI002008A1DF|nr:uncharacterized protein F5Y00DRAFT_55200 [Daldinia vernicosa]KAI0849625.1 hypothetical protein F5Y00DRAFT_55200 [Daldinia vernicosa]
MMWYIQGIEGLRDCVPKVHLVFRDPRTKYICFIMDYIDGPNLCKIWSDIPEDSRAHISFQIYSLIKLMQANTSRYPGPVGLGRSRVFMHPTLASRVAFDKQQYEAHLGRLVDMVNAQRGPAAAPLVKVEVDELVLGNMRLDPSSFVRDEVGRIWIVGWSRGGFYVPAAELAISIYLTSERFDLILFMLHMVWEDRRQEVDALVAVARYIDKGTY